ncbi:MAG: hypothetical protein WHS38_06665 [Thermodesulforhabdaceae bacterium]
MLAFLLALIFIVVIIGCIVSYSLAKTKRFLYPLMEALGIEKRWLFLSYRIPFIRNGEAFILDLSPQRDPWKRVSFDDLSKVFSTIRFKLSIACRYPFHFSIEKGVGSSKEYLSLDGGREGLYFKGEHKELLLRAFSENRALKPLIEKIIKKESEYIFLEKGRIHVAIECEIDKDLERIRNLPENLIQLRNILLEYVYPVEIEGSSSSSRVLLFSIYAFPIILSVTQLAVAIYINYLARNDFPVLNHFVLILATFALYGIPVAIYLVVTQRIVFNFPEAKRKLFVCFTMASIWFLTSFPLVMAINGYFDKSKPFWIEGLVENKNAKKRSWSIGISAVVQDGRKLGTWQFLGFPGISLSVTEDEYTKITPRVTLARLLVKEGTLKIPWIYGYVLYYDGKRKNLAYDYHFIGYKKYRQGNLNDAIVFYTEGINATGGDPYLYYNRGVAYRKKNMLKEAEADFLKTIERKPDMFEAYANLAFLMSGKDQGHSILDLWNRFVEAAPNDPRGYFERAEIFNRMGSKDKAMEDYKRACNLGLKKACRN